jgi:hypothetical protein
MCICIPSTLGGSETPGGFVGRAVQTSETQNLLTRYPIATIDTLSRPYLQLALCSARAGRTNDARAWLDAWQRNYPVRFRGPDEWLHHRARAAVRLADGKPIEALQEMREAMRYPPLRGGMFDDAFVSIADHPDLAPIYDRLGPADSAIAVYERYLAARSLNRSFLDAFELSPALARLAQLYEHGETPGVRQPHSDALPTSGRRQTRSCSRVCSRRSDVPLLYVRNRD